MTNQTEQDTIPSQQLPNYLMAALIDSANDAIISKTLDGTITSWNKGAERLFGYEASEIIGKSVLTLIPPDRQNEELEIVAKIRRGERLEHYETIRRRKDGSLIEISLTISPIHGPDGEILGASKIAHLVTDFDRAQRQIRRSEERYRKLFDSIDDGFSVIQVLFDEAGKAVNYRYEEINPAFERHSGLVDAQGKTMREFVPDHDGERFEIYGNVARTGEPIRFENYDKVLNRWFDLYAFPVDEPGKHRVAVLFSDITGRKRAEKERELLLQQLEAERSKLDYLFTQAPSFVATLKGPNHVFERTNPAYLQLVAHRDIIGKTVGDALPEIKDQGFLELLDSVFQNGEVYAGKEVPIQLQFEQDGPLQQRFLDFIYQPIFEADGSISGIFVHGVDITEQVKARKDAEAANRSKDDFLATLSHELRTPLTAIMGWTAILKSGQASPEEIERGLGTIERNTKAQAQLIEDILDVSRVITGKLNLQVQPVDLNGIIEETISTVLPAVQAKEIRLKRVLDAGVTIVLGDPARLQQVIWNLLSNAIKFTPSGGKLEIQLKRSVSQVEVSVSDNGQGITPDVLPHVFDRFRQADSTSTRAHGGLGLGLAIVRHLMELHGGSVEARSEGQGKGATFILRLPLHSVSVRPENLERRSTAELSEPLDLPRLDGLKIMVVDDQEDNRAFLTVVFEKCGAEVRAIPNPVEALSQIPEWRPHVLISDIGMPDEDGFSFIKKVRALRADEGGSTPAVALTAFARVEDRVMALRSGFQTHLTKPIAPLELVTVVANLSGQWLSN